MQEFSIFCSLHGEEIIYIDVAPDLDLGRRAVCNKCSDILNAIDLQQAFEKHYKKYQEDVLKNNEDIEKNVLIIVEMLEKRVEIITEELQKINYRMTMLKQNLKQQVQSFQSRFKFGQIDQLRLFQIQIFAEYVSQHLINERKQEKQNQELFFQTSNSFLLNQLSSIAASESLELDKIFNNLKNQYSLLKSAMYQFQNSQIMYQHSKQQISTRGQAKYISLNHNGSVIAIAFEDNIEIFQLCLQNCRIMERTRTSTICNAHQKEITAICLSTTGEWLATSGMDEKLQFWHVNGANNIYFEHNTQQFNYQQLYLIQLFTGGKKNQDFFITLNQNEIAFWVRSKQWEKRQHISNQFNPNTVFSLNLDTTLLVIGNKLNLSIFQKKKRDQSWVSQQVICNCSKQITKVIFVDEKSLLVQNISEIQIWSYHNSIFQIRDVFDLQTLIFCKSQHFLLTQCNKALQIYMLKTQNQFQMNLINELPCESEFSAISQDEKMILVYNNKKIELIPIQYFIQEKTNNQISQK